MLTLQFTESGMARTIRLADGETLIGRAATCSVMVNAPGVSRQHARVRAASGRAWIKDVGSSYGTTLNGAPLAEEREIHAGDVIEIGELVVTVAHAAAEPAFLSDREPELEPAGTILRRVDHVWPPAEPSPPAGVPVTGTQRAAAPVADLTPAPGVLRAPAVMREPGTGAQERRGGDRRKVDIGRPAGDRRLGRDRRGGRLLRLLGEIGRTLVTVQPLPQVLAKVADLVFDAIPAERVFLMLRESFDQPLHGHVMRNRDGSTPANVSLSRTVLSTVMRDRVAMLATDALSDARLDASNSIHGMNIRSFMCAPLWNRNDVIGVLYCDNPLSKKFTADDLEVFTALSNYAAVSIEQARLSQQLLEETTRRERLQRYHSPGVIRRILHSAGTEGGFIAHEREVSVMFCDIVGFTRLCENMTPVAVGELLNSYFGRMADLIFEHEGTLDKFIGDAILAVFGAPFDQPDHAARCVAAALAMRRALTEINATREAPIRMRIAINSGTALTGDIGSPTRRDFTVLGDVVNTASRIEGAVAQADQIVISQSTRALIGESFQLKPLGAVTLRGRESQTEVFEVLS